MSICSGSPHIRFENGAQKGEVLHAQYHLPTPSKQAGHGHYVPGLYPKFTQNKKPIPQKRDRLFAVEVYQGRKSLPFSFRSASAR